MAENLSHRFYLRFWLGLSSCRLKVCGLGSRLGDLGFSIPHLTIDLWLYLSVLLRPRVFFVA